LDIQGATEKIIQSYKEVEDTVSPKRFGESSPDVQTQFDLFLMAEQVLESVKRQAGHRELVFDLNGAPGLYIRMNPKVIEDVFRALLKNAIENTPDEGLIRISLEGNHQKCMLKVHDFGAGITAENQKYIFEGLFPTQETDLYSSKKPYDFNAGGKGLDLFRVKVYSQRFGFDILMDSKRCTYLPNNYDVCSGRISACPHCRTREDCLNSGGSIFGITLERCLPIH
jgi:signal transduction histidine kinase